MGDDSLIPISDEQAKLGQELVKAVRDTAGYFTDILGDTPSRAGLHFLHGQHGTAYPALHDVLWNSADERREQLALVRSPELPSRPRRELQRSDPTPRRRPGRHAIVISGLETGSYAVADVD